MQLVIQDVLTHCKIAAAFAESVPTGEFECELVDRFTILGDLLSKANRTIALEQ